MTNITLKQLRYAVSLAQTQHFGRAAQACSVSQPALSMQIKELEDSLGAPLFERTARSVRLTELGEAFIERARALVQQAEELGDFARAAQDRLAGQLRLGVIPTIAPYILPQLISALSRDHGELDLNIRESMTPRLVHDVMTGSLDMAMVALPISEPSLAEAPLWEEPFYLVRPKSDAGRPVPTADRLKTMRLLLLEEGHCFRDQALAFCKMRPVLPREALDGSSLSTLVQMVGAGIGVTLIPEMAVPVETKSAPVSISRFPDPQPYRRIGLVWRRSSPLAQHYQAIAKTVRAVGQALPRMAA